MPDEIRLAEITRLVNDRGRWRSRYYEESRTYWDSELPPGGECCAVCYQPVESEPCAEHHPATVAARLLARVAELEATLEKYVGHEPTVAEEMAYLNRCLNEVRAVCTLAEKQATRWEHPLPVPEWVAAVRKAAGGESPVEDEVATLRRLLADRDQEIAELKADEPTLDDDQPGVPQ